jgi:hypothetical protein
MSCAGCGEWSAGTPTACTSCSKAWKWDQPSASSSRNIPPTTPITASSQRSRFTHYCLYIRNEVCLAHRDVRGFILPVQDNPLPQR